VEGKPDALVDWVEEAVSLSNETVQIRERVDLVRVLRRVLRYNSQPETELRETHGRGRLIDPEEILLEDPALSGGRIWVPAEGRKPIERAQQECTRADRGIQQGQRAEDFGCFGIRVFETSLCLGISAPQAAGKQSRHSRFEDAVDQARRRIKRTRCVTGVRSHYPFEHPPEHVRGYAAMPPSLSHREVEALEQPVECVTPEIIGNVGAEPLLQGMGLEQPTIEEWNETECRGGPAPSLRWAVQRAKEKWTKEVAMYSAAPPQAPVHFFCQEPLSPGQPAFGLNEVEEEDPGEL
jgi:hypothetical protein